MAHNRPWYKRSGADFVMGAMGLPDADHKWAYSAIVDMLNDRDHPLPDDPGFICGFTGLTRKKWSIVRKRLLDDRKLVLVGDGYISNPRFEREHADRMEQHQAAVEAGRRGGLKAAANRAAEQAHAQERLDLQDGAPASRARAKPDYQADFGGNNGADKRPESPPDTRGTQPQKRQKTAKQDAPPPIPSRAREEARGQESPSNERTASRAGAREADPPPTDRASARPGLRELTMECCQAGGLATRASMKPALLEQCTDIVHNWQAAGVDIRRTALPAIRAQLQNMTEAANSLAAFTAAVDTAHTRATQQPRDTRKRKAPRPDPVFQYADESPSMMAYRQALNDRLPNTYPDWCGRLRFTLHDFHDEGDQALMRVESRGKETWTARDIVDSHGPLLRQIAQEVLGVKAMQ